MLARQKSKAGRLDFRIWDPARKARHSKLPELHHLTDPASMLDRRPWRMILAVSSRGVAGGVSIRGLLPTGVRQVTGQPRKANSKHSFHHDLSVRMWGVPFEALRNGCWRSVS